MQKIRANHWARRVCDYGRCENETQARIDTGAGVSSIDAKIVEIKPAADGSGERVIFQIKDDEGKINSIERTIVEWAAIKGKGTKQAVRLSEGGRRRDAAFTVDLDSRRRTSRQFRDPCPEGSRLTPGAPLSTNTDVTPA